MNPTAESKLKRLALLKIARADDSPLFLVVRHDVAKAQYGSQEDWDRATLEEHPAPSDVFKAVVAVIDGGVTDSNGVFEFVRSIADPAESSFDLEAAFPEAFTA